MSLVSLTFSDGNQSFSVPSMMHVFHPRDNIKVDPLMENKLQIVKVCTFFNKPTVYVVGQVVSGVVKEKMVCKVKEKHVLVSEVDSRLGGVGKEGMTVGFDLEGISAAELSKGVILSFSLQ